MSISSGSQIIVNDIKDRSFADCIIGDRSMFSIAMAIWIKYHQY